MTEPGDALLLDALNAVAGRRSRSGPPSPEWRAYAKTLRDARRNVREEVACPTAVLRRVQALYANRRGSGAGSLLRLVFDSWGGAVPATRGRRSARTLRFEGEAGAVDVRIVDEGSGRRVQIAAEPPRPGLVASVAMGAGARVRRLPLGEEAVGQLRLPAPLGDLEITVREGRRAVCRTPRIRLE